MVGFMPEETLQNWQFEHAMTTMFTCRSVIKFNTMLSNEQRQELIRDIDQSLQFLRSGFISASAEEQIAKLFCWDKALFLLQEPV